MSPQFLNNTVFCIQLIWFDALRQKSLIRLKTKTDEIDEEAKRYTEAILKNLKIYLTLKLLSCIFPLSPNSQVQ